MNYEVAKINFDSNKIESILTDMIGRTFPMVKLMSFLHNKIKSVQNGAFLFLTELEQLDLGDNQIKEIEPGAFFSQGKLQKLYLEGNHLKIIKPMAFEGLKNLKVLKINNNNLNVLDNEWLKQLSNLEELSVTSNTIKYLQPFDMKWPNNLRKVNLSNNSLGYIPNFPLFGSQIGGIGSKSAWLFDLSNNDISCDCVISDIKEYDSTELINIVCGLRIDCKSELGPSELQKWHGRPICDEKEGLRYVKQIQKQPNCEKPEMQLKASRSHEHLTKLRCEAKGIPIPEIKLKSKDGTLITTAEYKGNVATVYINTNIHPKSDVVCVATNSLGSVESSKWLVSVMDPNNVTIDKNCPKASQELKSSEMKMFVLAHIVFSL